MGRLIDADALINAINKSTCHCAEHLWKQVVCDVINNQSTAYDVERVVAELEEREEACKECYVEEIMTGSGGSASKYCGERWAYNNAIKIVKRGGVE